jgi:hypothetical protein
MATRTVAWEWVDDFLVEAAGREAPDPAEWGQLVDDIARRKDRVRGVLVATGGGAPDATQRAELTTALHGVKVPAAILSESATARLVITALNFFLHDQARPFSRAQVDAALSYLGVPDAARARVKAAVETLETRVARTS